ncbi:SHOCT domain-containing protein [Agromyces sp. SYSU T00194]|uniref:SHOCT domain-containing protein n=1 Tax=Agromyces chitinivorans TaxID=3158560 RepID=UPI00339847DA
MARTAVVAGTASAVAGGVQHRQANRWNAQQQQAAEKQMAAQQQQQSQAQVAEMQAQLNALQAQQAAPAAPAAPAGGGGDLMAELEKLANMKAAGILSDAEFAAAKAKLLG